MATQDKHNHHKQPRYFLKGFSLPPSYPHQKDRDIWVYKKGEPFKVGVNPSLEPVSKIGYSRDFYAFKKDDETLDFNTYENQLMKDFEQPGQPVMEKIRNFEEITTEEKDVFAKYVGSTITRGDWWRRVGEKALADSVEQVSEPVLKMIQSDEKRELLRKLINERAERLRNGELMKAGMIRKALDVSEILKLMVWRFVVVPKGMFYITSDKPIHYYYLQKPESELVFPLSSNVTLSLSWQDSLPAGHR